MKKFILSILISGLFGPAVADTKAVSKFRLDGDTLRYDTEADGLKKVSSITQIPTIYVFICRKILEFRT